MNFYEFLRKNFVLVLFVYLCNLVLICFWYYMGYFGDDIMGERFYSKLFRAFFIALLLELLCIHLFYCLFREKAKYFLVFLAVFAGLDFVVEGFLLYSYKTLFNPLIADALLQTNLKESYEFLLTYMGVYEFFLVIFGIFLMIMFFYWNKKSYLAPTPYFLAFKKIFYAIYLLVALIFILDILNKHYRKGEIESFAKLRDFSLTRIIHSFTQLYLENNLFTSTKEYEKNYEKMYLAYQGSVKTTKKIPHIVLVIGESAQRNHLSLYGNKLDTTPLARKLESDGNLIKFSDCIAPYAQTSFVLDYLLNFASAGDKDFSKRLNIIDLFKLGGYKTAYFSNQELASIHTRLTTAIANRADITQFLDPFVSHDLFLNKAYDGGLLEFVKEWAKIENSFSIVHLMGSHFSYKNRYPKEFEYFKTENIKMPFKTTLKEKEIIKDYENSLFYTDDLLYKIFKIYEDKEAIIIYLSDHGESLYEYKGVLGHFVTSRFVAEIPFYIMLTDKFKQNNKDLVEKILKAKDRPFMSDDLIHTLSYIANIKSKIIKKAKMC